MRNKFQPLPQAFVILAVLACWNLVSPPKMHSVIIQNANNAICTGTPPTCTPNAASNSFLDASSIAKGIHTNFCDTIYQMLNNTAASYTQGEIIDARGITSPSCSGTHTPWWNGSVYLGNKPSTILLPTGVITISAPWIIPSGTRLIGAGTNTTIIQACSPCSSLSPMLQFGAGTGTFACSPSPCTGIGVEHLQLDGNNQTLTGIENAQSQEQSYVDDVTLFRVLGKGVYIHGSAQNSGPYSNIVYDTNGVASSTAICVSIQSVSGGTRGVHGLTRH